MELHNVDPYISIPQPPSSKTLDKKTNKQIKKSKRGNEPSKTQKEAKPSESVSGLSKKAMENLEAQSAPSKPVKGKRFATFHSKYKKIFETKSTSKPIEENFIATPIPHPIANYLDENRLLTGEMGDLPIDPTHRDWFLNQATLLEQMKKTDPMTQRQLMLSMLHAYSKSATIDEENSGLLGIQTSPVVPEPNRYHRSTGNMLLNQVNKSYADDLQIQPYEIELIHSPLICEALARNIPIEGLNLNVSDKASFSTLCDELLIAYKKGALPKERILIDISKILENENIEPKDMQDLVKSLEDILIQKLHDFAHQNPDIPKQRVFDDMLSKLHLIALTTHKEQHLFLTPAFLIDPHPRFDAETQRLLNSAPIVSRHGFLKQRLNRIFSDNGFRLSPDEAKIAWLKIKEPLDLLSELNIPAAKHATIADGSIPKVCRSCKSFVKLPVVKAFRKLSKEEIAPPYLQILPEATFLLLLGLAEYKKDEGGIDQIFKDRGINDMLQISYFRVQNAMNEAILRREDPVAFNNQIELIHQEIQNILAIIEPYEETSLSTSITAKLKNGSDPLIPGDMEPKVHLKPSAMHSLSSVISSIEAEKGTNKLNVAVLKDSYYESSDVLDAAKTHHLSVLDGDVFNRKGLKAAFNQPPQKLDLFVGEFHHNISEKRQVYRTENITGQVKSLIRKGLVADKFTVVLDTTIDLEESDEIREFLNDSDIKDWIKQGQLNVVLLRSTQKFDMLGMDNYYGGITVNLNNPNFYERFNERMDHPQDQLRGLSFQGIAHLQKYGGVQIDRYREAVMKNTALLYAKLPKESIYKKGTKNPMQISKIEDNRLVFLDIKFPTYPKLSEAFKMSLQNFARSEKLPFTTRPSFGFSTTNFTIIASKKFRLNPGLDDEKTLERYANYFQAVQNEITRGMIEAERASLDKEQTDKLLAHRIQNMSVE